MVFILIKRFSDSLWSLDEGRDPCYQDRNVSCVKNGQFPFTCNYSSCDVTMSKKCLHSIKDNLPQDVVYHEINFSLG